jgi:hypothetical protein
MRVSTRTPVAISRGAGASLAPRLVALAGLLLAGCALFEPREVEAPGGDGGPSGRPPLSPSDVIHNLHAAVQAADPQLYASALADSGWRQGYRFLADPALAPEGGFWGRDEELAAWRNLCERLQLTGAVAPRLALIASDSTLFGDSASYSADYLLQLDASLATLGSRWAGSLRFVLSRHPQSGDWAIHQWEDWSADSSGGWTRLKQEFRWP